MFETDFPHRTSRTSGKNVPRVDGPSQTTVSNLAGIPQDVVKLLQDNAAKVYHLDRR
jgi:predicted TIM-barrel fold metal-dependent hydrolase